MVGGRERSEEDAVTSIEQARGFSSGPEMSRANTGPPEAARGVQIKVSGDVDMSAREAVANRAALDAFVKARGEGRDHGLALNIAITVWFAQCPWADGRDARTRVIELVQDLETSNAAPAQLD
jgi:hypothetical protein